MHNILVVDDEEDVRNLVKVILEAEGYKIDTASNGEEALDLMSENRFDMIILDVVMPKSDGLELCRKIKGNNTLRDTPIIMFSALGKGIETMLGDDEKADDYLEKPFEMKTLTEKVGRLLGNTA